MKRLNEKIILVDDEPFELELLQIALKDLGIEVELMYYSGAEDALKYLRTTQDRIFLIISDMNMPRMNGLEFKKTIDADPGLHEKAIPFIFSSAGPTKPQIREAYDYRLQGYFIKPSDLKLLARQLETIINYWLMSIRPDSDLLGPPKIPFPPRAGHN